MKFLATLLLTLISNSFAFNYDRMLTRQGYVNQGDGYYFKWVEGFERVSWTDNGYLNNFRYGECTISNDTLFCQTTFVDCDKYIYYLTIDHETYVDGILIEYELPYFGTRVIEADSYEDKVCTENSQ